MTSTSPRRRRAHIASAASALLLITGASAAGIGSAAEAAPGDSIVAVATGQATPKPTDGRSNASIVAAVAKARALAIPRAMINAQVQAAQMAAAAGLTLGPVTQVSQDGLAGLTYFNYNQLISTLGPNRYCGPTETRSVRRVNGKRTIVKRNVRKCYVPPFITTTLTVTYSATRP